MAGSSGPLNYEVRQYINGRTDWYLWAAFAARLAAEQWAEDASRESDAYEVVDVRTEAVRA